MIQQHLVKINELTQNISPVLPEKVKSNILLSLSDLQHQIDSTKILASNSFVQMSSWIKENKRMDVSSCYSGICICNVTDHW